MSRTSQLFAVCGVALLAVATGLFVHAWMPFFVEGGDVHMPDATLNASFRSHRPELEHLVKMAQHDRLGGNEIGGRTDLLNRLSPARRDAYQRTLRQIGAKHGFNRSGDGSIHIPLSERGAVGTGTSKGFYYSMEPPKPLVPSLDKRPPTSDREGILYRHLDGPWYLFYEWAE